MKTRVRITKKTRKTVIWPSGDNGRLRIGLSVPSGCAIGRFWAEAVLVTDPGRGGQRAISKCRYHFAWELQALIAVQDCEYLLVWCSPHSITCVSAQA